MERLKPRGVTRCDSWQNQVNADQKPDFWAAALEIWRCLRFSMTILANRFHGMNNEGCVVHFSSAIRTQESSSSSVERVVHLSMKLAMVVPCKIFVCARTETGYARKLQTFPMLDSKQKSQMLFHSQAPHYDSIDFNSMIVLRSLHPVIPLLSTG